MFFIEKILEIKGYFSCCGNGRGFWKMYVFIVFVVEKNIFNFVYVDKEKILIFG